MKPEAVKRAAEEAEEMHKQAYGEGEAPTEEETKPTLEVVEDTPTAEETPTEEAPAAEPVAEAVVDDKAEDAAHWKHKYDTLQGMFNANVPRLNAEIKALKEERDGLMQIVDQLKAAPQQAPAPEKQSLLTDEEREDYGPDMVEFAKKAAMEALGPELEQLRQQNNQLMNENASLKQDFGSVQADRVRGQRQNVFDELSRNVPNWVQINEQPEFLDWLAQVDVFSGDTRQSLLSQAFESNSAPRVVAFFKEYLNEVNLTSGQQGNQPTDTPSPTVNMDTLVAPGRPQRTTATMPESDATRNWTSAEIQQFYADVQRGKYKNDPAAKTQIETDIVRAGNEGRVIQ